MALKKLSVLSLLGFLAAALLTTQASAALIYNNSGNDLLTRINPGTKEIGDEITFSGPERFVTQFDFEWYGTNTANQFVFAGGAGVQARVKFYLNDGPAFNTYLTPGTTLFDSGWFGGFIGPTPRSTFVFLAGLDFPTGGLYIPANSITWSVQFQGMGVTDQIGLDVYDPPLVGSSQPDYWQNDGTGWTLLNLPGGPNVNFAARFTAVIPEPSSFAIVGVAVAGMWFRRRKS